MPFGQDLNTKALDFRTAAAVSEFTIEDRGLDVSKRAPTKSGMKTVLASESKINVEHRIRTAAIPLGESLQDDAYNSEALSIEGLVAMPRSLVRRLMPRRPDWSHDTSSGRQHYREVQAYQQWLDDIRDMICDRGGYPPAFEQNLQVWRQLWRVLERCHVAALVVDARNPLLHLPPALLHHVTHTLKKPLVVVLNKLDTVAHEEAVGWARCLRERVPGIAGVVGFSKENVRFPDGAGLGVGRDALIAECQRVVEQSGGRRPDVGDQVHDAVLPIEGGRIMIGLVGHPNVGKSSLVNNIMGGKVVSVKATPGHTKTLQTMNLDESTCLCDSPGVVFPRLEVPREVQIVGMLIPLAQVREPFSALRWAMEQAKTPLQTVLGLKTPTLRQVLDMHETGNEVLRLDDMDMEESALVPWSPMLICARYAMQRGLVRTGGLDTLAAGMEILERVLDGRVPYSVPPPATASAPEEGLRQGGEDSDAESDYQVDDCGYTSEQEDATAASLIAKGDLMTYFGEERTAPGSRSIASKKRQDKLQKRLEADAGLDKDKEGKVD